MGHTRQDYLNSIGIPEARTDETGYAEYAKPSPTYLTSGVTVGMATLAGRQKENLQNMTEVMIDSSEKYYTMYCYVWFPFNTKRTPRVHMTFNLNQDFLEIMICRRYRKAC